MPFLKSNGIEIAYEETGQKHCPAILLIMGLGSQLIAWPDELFEGLGQRGFRVIRFDNRDIGLSTKFEGARDVDPELAMVQSLWGWPVRAPYRLRDMANDSVGVLDALGIVAAHIVGASMGGMIAQIVAGEHPTRTRSLVSIMSTTGQAGLPPPKRDVLSAVLSPHPRSTDPERALRHAVAVYRAIGSPGHPTPEAELRERLTRAFKRSYYPAGLRRQFVAVLASGGRTALLRQVRAATLVIHGTDDPLIPLEGGRQTAANVPGARLLTIDGMGHDLPPQLLPYLTDTIASHCQAADLVRIDR